ncbi:siderophore-interacting protein [Motilibacter deserti]|uniref:Siderophore-interacting protein n=1 Tax=Motilibacter deserti TaxID=2714956 RepID=A0ABX0GVK6_9ACTN|nr:siderophore-interacting protein [Motilibacter deserti]NHC14543.1 siderophore-interacting protein [Motilibacter deserti]
MTLADERVRRVGPMPVQVRLLEVLRTERVTPGVVRVTLGGPQLEGFRSSAPDDHVKLFFPVDGRPLVLPLPGPNGVVWPEGVERPPARDYTPRRHDPVAGELDIDVVLHGDGPAATWAASARPGDRVGLGGPRGSLLVSRSFEWYLLVGDESALPAIGRRIAEAGPDERIVAVVEVAGPEEEQPLPVGPVVSLTWVHRSGAEPGAGTGLLDAVRALALPPGDFFAYVAGEAGTVRAVREHLLAERGARKEWMRATGYWKRGVANHHD